MHECIGWLREGIDKRSDNCYDNRRLIDYLILPHKTTNQQQEDKYNRNWI